MSETRSHISADDILHVAEVAHRPRAAHPRAVWNSSWRTIIIVLFGICVIVGFVNLVARAAAFLNRPTASAELVQNPIDVVPVSRNATSSGAHMGGITPARLSIPAIGVNANVESVGLNAAGAMQAPSSFTSVGWYKGGSEPGATGSAVIDGHVNNALTEAGVFEHLNELQAGDSIVVSDASGNTRTFTVSSVKTYGVDAAPTSEIFSQVGPSTLALITCEGTWVPSKKEFDQRLVVTATLSDNG